MSLTLDSRAVALHDINALKAHLRSQGYATKVVLDDDAMEKVGALVTADQRYQQTPPGELRYMEGLLDLPLGFIDEFGFIPAAGHETCICGRIPSALDVVLTALKQGIHSKVLVRDTILGAENVFEMADSGRKFACISCANEHLMAVYHWRGSYMYA